MNKNPLKLRQVEKRLLQKRTVVMVHKVKEMVHRKKRVKHLRKKREIRMALSSNRDRYKNRD